MKRKRRLSELQILQLQRGMLASGTATPMPVNEIDIHKLREDIYKK